MRFKVIGQRASSFIILFLLALASSLDAATVKIIPSAISADSIVQTDGVAPLPSNAAFSIGTFVADPDSNPATIAALLSSGSAVTNLYDPTIIFALDLTYHRSEVKGMWLTN